MSEIKFWRYAIPSSDGLSGWGIFLLDSTGMFAAVTDYGNCAFKWTHHGCKDFREFFGTDADYYMNKLFPEASNAYNGQDTEKYVRESILEMRRYGSLTEEKAREHWDLLDNFDFYYQEEFSRWVEEENLNCGAWEWAQYGFSPKVRAFAENLWPRFLDSVQADLNVEKGVIAG